MTCFLASSQRFDRPPVRCIVVAWHAAGVQPTIVQGPAAWINEAILSMPRMPHSPLALVLLVATLATAHARPASSIYAIYGIKSTAQSGIRSVNVAVIPSGSQSECQHQIDVYERGMRKRGIPQGIELIPSSCTMSLHPDLRQMVQGHRLKGAYIVITSGEWAPVYTAWYHMPPSDPGSMCQRLIAGMRATLTGSKANFACLQPQ